MNKAEILKIICCLIFILLTSFVLAPTPEQEAFSKQSTLANFNQLKNPTTTDFNKLSVTNQADYLLKPGKYKEEFAKSYLNSVTSFSDSQAKLIGDKFFIQSKKVSNINQNQKSFQKYVQEKYSFSSFTLNSGSQIKKFDGKLFETEGKASSSLKNIQDLEGKNIVVKENGEIVIEGIKFTGLEYNYDKKTKTFSNPNSGYINNHYFSKGKEISVDPKTGQIKGFFSNFKGIIFQEKQPVGFNINFINYDQKNNILSLVSGTEIVSISSETSLDIKGTNIVLPNGDKLTKGMIYYDQGKPSKIKENSEILIQGIKHQTKKGIELQLVFAGDQLNTAPITKKTAQLPDYEGFKFIRMATNIQNIRDELKAEGYTEEQINNKMIELVKSDFATTIGQKEVLPRSQGGKNYGGKDLISIFSLEAKGKVDLTDESKKPPVLEFPRKVRVNGQAAWLEFDKTKGKWDYVWREQDIAKVADQCKGNCFVYGTGTKQDTGTEQLVVKGKGFTSTITPENKIFEATDFGWGTVRKYNLQISPGSENQEKTGYVHLKVEPYEKFLALKTVIKDEAKIEDGKWELSFNQNEVYSKKLTNSENPDGADMRILYENKEYDLDVDGVNPAKQTKLTEEDQKKIDIILENKKKLNADLSTLEEIRDGFEQKEFEKDSKYNRLQARLAELEKEVIILKAQGKISNTQKIDKEIRTLDDQLSLLESEKRNQLEKDNSQYYITLLKINGKQQELSENQVKDNEIFNKYLAQKIGTFSQKIKSGQNDVTYSEFIEDTPLIRNTETRIRAGSYYGSTYRTAGKLERNYDILFTPLTKERQCVDDQIIRYAEYKISKGEGKDLSFPFTIKGGELDYTKWKSGDYKNYRYYNGEFIHVDDVVIKAKGFDEKVSFNDLKAVYSSYNQPASALKDLEKAIPPLQTFTSDRSYLSTLGIWTGTKTYHKLREQNKLQEYVIPINKPGDLRPGDVFMLDKHSIAIKEIVEIEGKKYAKLYSGSTPAVDIRISPTYIPVTDLLKEQEGKLLYAFRWK